MKVIILCICLNFVIVYSFNKSKTDEEINLKDYQYSIKCRERIRKIRRKENDLYDLVTVKIFSKLVLLCHYCREFDSNKPKIWFKKNRFTSDPPEEVILGTNSRLSDNRVYVTPHHALVIKNITISDAGIYYCHGLKGEDEKFKFNYLVDVIKTIGQLAHGNIGEWRDSILKNHENIKKMFFEGDGEFETIRNMGINIELITEWGKWGPCNGCTKVRKRIFECKIMPRLMTEEEEVENINSERKNVLATSIERNELNEYTAINTSELNNSIPIEQSPKIKRNSEESHYIKDTDTTTLKLDDDRSIQFLKNSNEFSCFSIDFANLFPNISQILSTITSFALTEYCYAPCQFSPGTGPLPKYKNTILLSEGEAITFMCPEASVNNEIVWRKDGITLQKNSKQGHATVDFFSNLYISSASDEDAANYTCYVDGQKIQEIILQISVQSLVTKQAFVRHIQYLGFIFLFSTIFYIVGVILAWARKNDFKKLDYSDFQKKPNYIYWKLKSMSLKEEKESSVYEDSS